MPRACKERALTPRRSRAQAESAGDVDGGIFTAGQVVGLIDDVPTVKQFMDSFIREAESTIKERLGGMLLNSGSRL